MGDKTRGDNMEWMEKLNQSITYIENNLEGTIDYNEAAKIACCSTFHFQRMFSYIAGVTLSEYIRRRRMSKAAFELQNSHIKILDLSAKYGYDSPTSFSRAFQSIHNVSPSAARQKGTALKTYPKLVFSITVKGHSEIRYRIEKKAGFRIVGIRKKFDLDLEKNFLMVPEFWDETRKSELLPQLLCIMNGSPRGVLGITAYHNQSELFHYIAVATDKPAPWGTVEYVIPPTAWAVFECTGPLPDSVQQLYRRFYTEWLPFSGYEYAENYDIEVYPEQDEQLQKVQIWFSIKEPGKK